MHKNWQNKEFLGCEPSSLGYTLRKHIDKQTRPDLYSQKVDPRFLGGSLEQMQRKIDALEYMLCRIVENLPFDIQKTIAEDIGVVPTDETGYAI
jgi:hypothetical protein